MFRSRLLALFVICLLTVPAGAAIPASATDEVRDNDTCDGRACIQIGTFNLDSLGSGGTATEPLRTQTEVQRLVDLIVELDLEIVALQEINTSLSVVQDGVTTSSSQQWRWLRKALKRAGYRTDVGSGSLDRRLVIAYARKEVKRRSRQSLLVSQSIQAGPGCAASNLPLPLAATFEAGQLRLTLVAAQLLERGTDASCSDAIRTEQAEQLAAAINSQLGADPGQVFLAGDFGTKARHRSLQALRQDAGFKELTAKKSLAPASGSASALGSPRGLFDHLFYRVADSRDTWVARSTEVFDPEAAGADYADYIDAYSDHAPVFTSLYTEPAAVRAGASR